MALIDDYYVATEWNLATLEELASLSSSSRSRIQRQRQICIEMLYVCRQHEADLGAIQAVRSPRVREILKLVASGKQMDASVDEFCRLR